VLPCVAQILARSLEGCGYHCGIDACLLCFYTSCRRRHTPFPIPFPTTWRRGYIHGGIICRGHGWDVHDPCCDRTSLGLRDGMAKSNIRMSVLVARGWSFWCRGLGAWSFVGRGPLGRSTFFRAYTSRRDITKCVARTIESRVFPVGCLAIGCGLFAGTNFGWSREGLGCEPLVSSPDSSNDRPLGRLKRRQVPVNQHTGHVHYRSGARSSRNC
jgi:hypothetical protein